MKAIIKDKTVIVPTGNAANGQYHIDCSTLSTKDVELVKREIDLCLLLGLRSDFITDPPYKDRSIDLWIYPENRISPESDKPVRLNMKYRLPPFPSAS